MRGTAIIGLFECLLVALDGSENGARALSFAIELAQRNKSRLLLCHAVDHAAAYAECSSAYGGLDLLPLVQSLDETATSILEAAAHKAIAAGLVATTMVTEGRAAEAIAACASEQRVDAIVMGTQGNRGLKRFFMGSTAEGVLQRSDVPVFVVPVGALKSSAYFERILVAVDASEPGGAAAAFALELSAVQNARLIFCGVAETKKIITESTMFSYDPTAMIAGVRSMVGASLATQMNLGRQRNVACESFIAEGEPADEILQTAGALRVDLIVTGTHGRRGLRRLFVGSVAEAIVCRSSVPIAVVRTAPIDAPRAIEAAGAASA